PDRSFGRRRAQAGCHCGRTRRRRGPAGPRPVGEVQDSPVSRFWSRVVHELTPYVPGEQPKVANLVKRNTNENPYGPGPKVLEALRAAANDNLRLYPDPGSDRLRDAIAARHGVKRDQVFVGNG